MTDGGANGNAHRSETAGWDDTHCGAGRGVLGLASEATEVADGWDRSEEDPSEQPHELYEMYEGPDGSGLHDFDFGFRREDANYEVRDAP